MRTLPWLADKVPLARGRFQGISYGPLVRALIFCNGLWAPVLKVVYECVIVIMAL